MAVQAWAVAVGTWSPEVRVPPSLSLGFLQGAATEPRGKVQASPHPLPHVAMWLPTAALAARLLAGFRK